VAVLELETYHEAYFVNYCYVVLKKHNTVRKYALGLAHRIFTRYLLVQVLQMQILNRLLSAIDVGVL
jgi:hypothetical protein